MDAARFANAFGWIVAARIIAAIVVIGIGIALVFTDTYEGTATPFAIAHLLFGICIYGYGGYRSVKKLSLSTAESVAAAGVAGLIMGSLPLDTGTDISTRIFVNALIAVIFGAVGAFAANIRK